MVERIMTHGPILIYIVGTWYIKQLLIHQILKGFTNMWVPVSSTDKISYG